MTIKIKNEQMLTMSNLIFDRFIDEVASYCDIEYPNLSKQHGEEQLKKNLKTLIEQGIDYGFTIRGSCRYYIDLSFIFGTGFATDPQYTWILDTYKKDEKIPEIERVDTLWATVNRYLKDITGENGAYDLAAIQAIENLNFDLFHAQTDHFDSLLMDILQRTYQGKAPYMSTQALVAFVQYGLNKSKNEYALEDKLSCSLFVLLMYFYGHEFDRDPLLGFDLKNASLSHHENTTNTYTLSSTQKPLYALLRQWPRLKVYYREYEKENQ